MSASALASSFLHAAVEPARWLGALGELAEATGSNHAELVGIGADYATRFNWVSGLDARQRQVVDLLKTHAPAENFRVAAAEMFAGEPIVAEEHYAGARAWLVSDDYPDICQDIQIPNGAQLNVRQDASGLIGLALLRSDANGRTGEAERAMLAAMRRPVDTAITLQLAIEEQGYALVRGSFEAMAAACFVLDAAMQVRAATPAAEAALSAGHVRVVDGRVALAEPEADRRLITALAAIAGGRGAARRVLSADPGGTTTVTVSPLPHREWSLGFAPFAVVAVKRSGVRYFDAAALVADTFALTVTETEIALLLAAGEARPAICARRGIGAETLRSHLRALFQKMGVRREPQALHLLHTLIG